MSQPHTSPHTPGGQPSAQTGQPQHPGAHGQPPAPHPGSAPSQWPAAGQGSAPGQWSAPAAPGSSTPPPPGPRKKPLLKRWWFWVVAVVALFAVIGIAGGGGDEPTADTAGADSAPAADVAAEGENADSEGSQDAAEADAPGGDAPATYGLGDPVPTGDWEITVADVEEGVTELGDEYFGTTAQGQFILVEVSVKNTGSSPSYFFEDDVQLGDDAGNTYSADSSAGMYTAEDSDLAFLEEINPGNTATGVIAFDVPADATPNVLEFQGGIFDTPAEVALD